MKSPIAAIGNQHKRGERRAEKPGLSETIGDNARITSPRIVS